MLNAEKMQSVMMLVASHGTGLAGFNPPKHELDDFISRYGEGESYDVDEMFGFFVEYSTDDFIFHSFWEGTPEDFDTFWDDNVEDDDDEWGIDDVDDDEYEADDGGDDDA